MTLAAERTDVLTGIGNLSRQPTMFLQSFADRVAGLFTTAIAGEGTKGKVHPPPSTFFQWPYLFSHFSPRSGSHSCHYDAVTVGGEVHHRSTVRRHRAEGSLEHFSVSSFLPVHPFSNFSFRRMFLRRNPRPFGRNFCAVCPPSSKVFSSSQNLVSWDAVFLYGF